jgi:hypothetical protein
LGRGVVWGGYGHDLVLQIALRFCPRNGLNRLVHRRRAGLTTKMNTAQSQARIGLAFHDRLPC